MQVFRAYFKILNKHKISVIIYTVMFLAITIAITSKIDVSSDKFEVKKVKIMIVNNDGKSALTDGFLDYLKSYATFVEPKGDEEARRESLFFGETEYILTIPKGFSDSFIKGKAMELQKQTIPNSMEAMSIDNVIDSYLNIAKVYLKDLPGLDSKKMNGYIKAVLKDETQVKLNKEVKDSVVASNEFNSNFFNYLAYVIIAVSISAVSMIMFSFNRIDIRRRQTASPLTSRQFNLQLLLANLFFVFAFLVMFIVAGYILNSSRMINTNTILIWLNGFVFSLTALSISYLIGITVAERKAIAVLSTVISLSLSFLSGVFVPQMYLGASVLRVATFLPTYWYVKANNALMNVTSFQWSDISRVFGYMAIETGFTIAIISIAMVVSKRKRRQTF